MKLQSSHWVALVASLCSSAILAGPSSPVISKVAAPLPGKSVKTTRVEFKDKGRKSTSAVVTTDEESDEERTLKRIEREALEKPRAAVDGFKAPSAPRSAR